MPLSAPAQATTVRQFIHAINMLPEHASQPDVEHALLPALQYEQCLRYELDPQPYIGLLNVFDIPSHCRQSRLSYGKKDQDRLFPLSLDSGNVEEFNQWADTLRTFKRNFDIFTHGVLRSFDDWDNVIVAGGSVLAAMLRSHDITKNDLVRDFSAEPYKSSDIDIFLWGLTPAEAEMKMCAIYEAVKTSVPWDVVAVRKANVVSIHTQYPYRPIQIVLRLYQSPTEVLIGFDVDCCSVCYDGESVWATPRALASIILRRLTIDMSRRSPSYEIRLAKYASRGFEIYYPKLRRWSISPSLYDRYQPVLPTGLARLLILEKLYTDPGYYEVLAVPGQPSVSLESGVFPLLKIGHGVEEYTSNYESAAFKIPYALNWDAHCIKKLDKRTENWLTLVRYTSGEYLHKHAMRVFSDIGNCFANICLDCPEPRNIDELQEQERNDLKYIRGPLQFRVQNPGQQLITGSFNPITNEIGSRALIRLENYMY